MNDPIPVLIVDDDPNLRKTLGDVLTVKGYNPLVMESGREALEAVVRQEIPVAVIDLKLVEMSGLETLRRIRAASPTTECILLTGYASQETAIEAVNLGAYSYIHKPYNLEHLFLTLRNAVEKHRSEKALRQSELKYRLLHESLMDAFVLTDMKGRLKDWNPVFRDLLGYSDEELANLTYQSLTPSRWQAFETRIIREQVLPRGHSEVYEKEYIRKGGSLFPAELRSFLLKDQHDRPVGFWAIVRDITGRKAMEAGLEKSRQELERKNRLLSAVARTQSRMIGQEGPGDIFKGMLEDLLALTSSQFGFIGEVLRTKEGQPYLKTYALSDISWNEATRTFYQDHAPRGLEFFNLNTLFGEVLKTEKPVIANDPANDSRSGGLPEGHPSIRAFLGLPFVVGEELIGMVGLANRAEGYEEDLIPFLQPLLAACGEIIEAFRALAFRRAAKEALEQSRREWEDIFQAIGHPTLILGPNQRILAVNRVGEEVVGTSGGEIIGRKCYEVFHKASAPPDGCPFLKLTHSGAVESSGMEMEALGRFFLVSCTPVLDQDGNLEKVIHLATDITERKKTEESLRHAEQRYRNLFEEAPAMYVITRNQDGHPVIADCNELFLRTIGYSREEVLHLPLGDLYSPESRYQMSEGGGYQRALTGRFQNEERELVTRDGRILSTLLRALPEADAQGRVWGTRAMFVDISEKRKAESAREKLEDQLRQAQKLEAVGRLAGGVAHDFNNLLSVILGYGELVLNTLHQEHPAHEPLKAIYEAGMRAKDLTRQLLAFSRKQVLEIKVVDINTVIRGFEKLLGRIIGEDVEVALRLTDQSVLINADPSQLEQVLMNLAVNARDAMPGGGRLTIETSNIAIDGPLADQKADLKPGPYVLIRVSDTGCGMARSTLDRLFEPFFTTKEMGKGTGLGLATSYGIIKQHNGGIWAYSEPGKGTTFSIYLPLSGQSEKTGDTASAYPADLRGSETILLVEDDEPLRRLTSAILKRQGYQVLIAESGQAALAILDRFDQSIHLLLTDVVMPGMSGKDLFTRISGRFPQMKCLFMSGYSEDTIAQHGIPDEGINFIQKPFTMDTLALKVRKVLAGMG